MSDLSKTLSTKERIVAVDILRILAAFLLMFAHLRGTTQLVGEGPTAVTHMASYFGSMSSIFFVLGGFFACRNITWKKALYNSLWCLLPLILWTYIASGGKSYQFFHGFGLTYFFLPDIPLFKSTPHMADPPLWFMRDLVFLFLLSPILAKYARYIFPALVVLSVIPECVPHFMHTADIHQVCLRPYSIAFFSAGCFLASFDSSVKKKILSYYSVGVVLCFLAFSIAEIHYLHWTSKPFLVNLLGMWILYQIARIMEVYLPCVKPFALKYAPVTFLTFAAHWELYKVFKPYFTGWFALLIPFIVFGVLSLFFFAMKRWCRPLLHLVAHYKLRPDDFPAKKNEPEAQPEAA